MARRGRSLFISGPGERRLPRYSLLGLGDEPCLQRSEVRVEAFEDRLVRVAGEVPGEDAVLCSLDRLPK